MRVLLVGAGGVGGSIALIAARRNFFELMVVADFDAARAAQVAQSTGDPRFIPALIDASDSPAVAALLAEHRCDVLMNATDPRFVMPLFTAALAGGAHYLDMAMSLSKPHPTDPHNQTGVKVGDEQFALADQWEAAGRLALVGMGIEPGMVDVFARYAADELFSEIAELGCGTGPTLGQPGRRRIRLRAELLHLDHDRGMPEPAGDLREGPRLVHHGAVQRTGGVRVPRRHRPGRMCQCRT